MMCNCQSYDKITPQADGPDQRLLRLQEQLELSFSNIRGNDFRAVLTDFDHVDETR